MSSVNSRGTANLNEILRELAEIRIGTGGVIRIDPFCGDMQRTPVWSREDAKTLLDSIPKDSVSGLRDLALIAAMFYSFARVSAVLKELVSYCAS